MSEPHAMDPALQQGMLAEYDQQISVYRDLTGTAASLLGRILDTSGVQLHSITQRCKTRESLADKLAKPDKDYVRVQDVTDLAAVRITTYFAEDVDRVAEVVEREFVIDRASSIDKRKLLDPDRFGYQSLHYVVSFTSERCGLVEYARFRDLKFEIQLRSILQHAWAEIEHDLGYKSAAGVPRDIRRRFSRIAGLLELADDEFCAIRRELAEYADAVPQEIREQPQNVGIDKISLRALVSSEQSATRRLSVAVAEVAGANLEPARDDLLEAQVVYLNAVGISTIAALEQAATSRNTIVRKFATRWLGERRYETLNEGIGILYLAYVLASESNDEAHVRSFFDTGNLGGSDRRDELVTRALSTYREAAAQLS